MDDPVVEVQCEKCEQSFAIKASDYEKAMQNEQLILCDVCFGLLLEEQREAASPIRRKFEYLVIDVASFVDEYGETEWELISVDEYGKKGWELISVDNNRMYFKRELLEGTG